MCVSLMIRALVVIIFHCCQRLELETKLCGKTEGDMEVESMCVLEGKDRG